MDSATSYKAAKEAFVSHTTGSTINVVMRISSITICSLLLYQSIQSRLKPEPSLLLDFVIMVLPILVGLTWLADNPIWISSTLTLLSAILLSFPQSKKISQSLRKLEQIRQGEVPVPPLSSLTTYRANMMLLTVICILAVDFPVFPRWAAKCETWGVSMMDLGVGSFVFSQGLVSAIPFLKDPSRGPSILVTIKKVSPVLALGLVRVLLVKGTDYPEHVTEYGVHWNFFITLGVLPIASALLQPLLITVPIPVIGLFISACHQLLLSYTALQDWTIGGDRSNLLAMNKEGVVSLPGYLAIHVLGFAIGTLILPPSPAHFRRKLKTLSKPVTTAPSSNPTYNNSKLVKVSEKRQLDKTVIELCSYVLVWWTLYGVTVLSSGRFGVSRRLANLPYVLLVTAYNSTFLLAYMSLELLFAPTPSGPPTSPSNRPRSDTLEFPPDKSLHDEITEHLSGDYVPPPPLFEAINRNGLVIFLLANVATGVINLSIPTMYTSDLPAMGVLVGYTAAVCGIAWAVRGRRLVKL